MVYKKSFMKELEENIINLYGAKGVQWLSDLPKLVEHLEISCGLSNLKPFKNLTYNYVLSGFQGLQPIVLKLSLDHDDLKREALALKAFAGFGTVKVLRENDGMLLIERAIPGVSLKSYFPEKDDEAIQIIGACLKQLHQAPIRRNYDLPHINDWLVVLDKELNIPTDYLHKARSVRDMLIASSAKPILLHGDLHHDNILQNGKELVVIDPKGVIGESAYDVAAFIRNPIPQLLEHPNALGVIDNRITQFAKILQLSKQRIIDWCYVQAVLAWAWTLEDNGDEAYFRKLTELFSRYS